MSLEYDPVRIPIDRIINSELINRVVPFESANDSGNRGRNSGDGDEQRRKGEHDDDTPRDVVDLSDDYLYREAVVVSRAKEDNRRAVVSAVVRRTDRRTRDTAEAEQRHVDISV